MLLGPNEINQCFVVDLVAGITDGQLVPHQEFDFFAVRASNPFARFRNKGSPYAH